MAKKPNKFLFWFGIVMMVTGFFITIAGLPLTLTQPTIIAETPIGSVTATNIPQTNETRIIIGAVLIVLGLGIFIASYKIDR